MGSGVVVWERKAAAAAAEEREVVEGEVLRKARLAAVAAEALGAAALAWSQANVGQHMFSRLMERARARW